MAGEDGGVRSPARQHHVRSLIERPGDGFIAHHAHDVRAFFDYLFIERGCGVERLDAAFLVSFLEIRLFLFATNQCEIETQALLAGDFQTNIAHPLEPCVTARRSA